MGNATMNISKMAEWLTIATNIAVLAGIGALVYEINQNTKQLRAQASYNLLLNRSETRTDLLNNSELADFWTRLDSGSPPTAADIIRIEASAERALLKWQWEYGQYVDGNLSLTDLPVSAYRAAYRGDYNVSLSGLPDAWLNLKGGFRPDFVAWMESNVINQ